MIRIGSMVILPLVTSPFELLKLGIQGLVLNLVNILSCWLLYGNCGGEVSYIVCGDR